jgi:hypothetical protein
VRSWFPPSADTTKKKVKDALSGLPAPARAVFAVWCLWLLVPALVGYVLLTRQQVELRQAAVARHAARLDPTKNDAVSTKLDLTPPSGHEHDPPAARVETGVYVTRIPKVSIVDASWHVDFYIWFVWHGSDINPGETFKIVSGEISSKSLMRKSDEGDRHYALYRVNAEITKAFDISRFPRDEHMLTIVVEDQGLQYYQMVYTTEPSTSEISSRVEVLGYAIAGKHVVTKGHTYKTTMGDPSLPPGSKATYANFVFAIDLVRPDWGFYLKMFLPLFLAVALALAGLFVTGPAERLGIVSTALFVAVINGMTVNTMIPGTGTTTLAEIVGDIGYAIIGQTLLQAILYGRYFADRSNDDRQSLLFDRSTFVILAAQAVVLNVGVVLAASG